MTKAVAVRREGDAFQARLFWRRAACLLDPASPVAKVGFESGPKGFDDLWVEYASGRGPGDQEGKLLQREHLQCKWHVTIGDYGYADLVNPEFINASSHSFLRRARDAQVEHAADGTGARFKLLTNWRIAQTDPLRPLISQRSKTLRLDDLFGTKTDASAAGKIRKLWREHLGIDNEQLRMLARTLAFDTDSTSLDEHRELLDILFQNCGLRRIPAHESSFVYDDLPFQWLGQGRLEFDRQSFRQLCLKEGLFRDDAKVSVAFGVKSFEHAFDRLEDRCTAVLNLIPHFNERAIRDQADWASTLYPELRNFLRQAAKTHESLRLALDAHSTLAFAAGSVLDVKSGRHVGLEQRTMGRHIWHAGDVAQDAAWPQWVYEIETLNAEFNDIAVAVSLTHDVVPKVKTFIAASLPQVGRLLMASPSGGPSARAVACGQHAFDLAETITQRINQERPHGKPPLHLFIAAPNAFTFFLGQRQPGLGKVTLYEYDFEGQHGGSYAASLTLPI